MSDTKRARIAQTLREGLISANKGNVFWSRGEWIGNTELDAPTSDNAWCESCHSHIELINA